jgi:hypothetical protein
VRLVLAIALAALVLVAGSVGSTHASFTASVGVAGNGFRVATVEDTFDVQPGSAVRAGTATPVATGSGQSLALDFGFVPSARAFTTVFTVRNRTSSTQTAVLETTALPAQVAGVTFASTGTTTAVIAAGASTAVTVTTSPTTAGRGSGLLRLRIGGSTWLYRDYPLSLDAAPQAPASTSVIPRAAGRLALTWSASTTTNVASYEIWRANGGAAARVATDVTGTSWTDDATTDGVAYAYTVRAVSSGTPSFTSLDGPGATATADATPPAVPTSVSIPGGWVNLANRSSVTVQVALPSGSAASDVVTITAGGTSKTVAAPAGAGTVSTTFDLSGTPDGSVSLSASAADVAGNASGSRSGSASKDTVAPGAPTATYTDSNKTNVADVISGAAESGATVRATQTAPSASGPYTTTAAGGAYSVSVSSGGKDVTVTYQLTATDAAGNTGPTTTLTALSSR